MYILGDLFEYWIGDDVGLDLYRPECSALADTVAAGVPVAFLRGNRDFLVGRRFTRRTGVPVLPDPYRVDLHGADTLLTHGDRLCTDDVHYQRWRRFANNPLAQFVFLSLPRGLRERIAGGVRARSRTKTQRKPVDIMDVNREAVAQAFQRHAVPRIIHGHTHRPADHREVGGLRIVLADWTPQRTEYLAVDGTGHRRVNWAAAL